MPRSTAPSHWTAWVSRASWWTTYRYSFLSDFHRRSIDEDCIDDRNPLSFAADRHAWRRRWNSPEIHRILWRRRRCTVCLIDGKENEQHSVCASLTDAERFDIDTGPSAHAKLWKEHEGFLRYGFRSCIGVGPCTANEVQPLVTCISGNHSDALPDKSPAIRCEENRLSVEDDVLRNEFEVQRPEKFLIGNIG